MYRPALMSMLMFASILVLPAGTAVVSPGAVTKFPRIASADLAAR